MIKLSCCNKNKAETPPVENAQQAQKGTLRGRCIIDKKVISGLSLLIFGLALVSISAILAAGIFGGGAMYLFSGGAVIVSIPVFIGSTLLLVDPPKAYYTLGDASNVRELEEHK